MQLQTQTKILISPAWKDADLYAPLENKSIAFTVEGHPMPIAGFFDKGSFWQCIWDFDAGHIRSEKLTVAIERWRYLEIGTKEESESSFAVLEGDR